MKNFSKTLSVILATVVVTVILIFAALVFFLSKNDIPFLKLIKIANIIESSYVGDFDVEKSEEAAINAVLDSIDDKYAVYYDEENAKETFQILDGSYIGIGIEIFANTQKNRIEVISAYEESPADKAGIQKGDLIVSIDGNEYTAANMADAVLYMKGAGIKNPLEETVEITLQRGDSFVKTRLKRAKIDMYKVTNEVIDDICYIRYSGFTKNSEKELEKIINSLDKEKIKGIIIDIRNNPGGDFGSSINMCDLFLDEGTIMYTVDKNGEKTVYSAKEGSCDIPLAVIVNGSSASASEIFAGAMQDTKRAVIVGEKTYGKGVTQTIRYINPIDESEGAIKLTTCKNYTPGGKWINESIVPDIEIKTDKIEGSIKEDAAFIAAKEYLEKGKITK